MQPTQSLLHETQFLKLHDQNGWNSHFWTLGTGLTTEGWMEQCSIIGTVRTLHTLTDIRDRGAI